jgi:hypothetical protein
MDALIDGTKGVSPVARAIAKINILAQSSIAFSGIWRQMFRGE